MIFCFLLPRVKKPIDVYDFLLTPQSLGGSAVGVAQAFTLLRLRWMESPQRGITLDAHIFLFLIPHQLELLLFKLLLLLLLIPPLLQLQLLHFHLLGVIHRQLI